VTSILTSPSLVRLNLRTKPPSPFKYAGVPRDFRVSQIRVCSRVTGGTVEGIGGRVVVVVVLIVVDVAV